MEKMLMCLVLTAFFQTAQACVCSPDLFENVIKADFIGEVKITKTYQKESSDYEYNYYKIDVETITVYKGEKLQTLYVYGSNGATTWTSCDLTVFPNTTWLVYSTKDARGNFVFGMCTSSHQVRTSFTPYDSLAYSQKVRDNIVKGEKNERNFLLEVKKYDKDFGKQNSALPSPSWSFIPNLNAHLETFKGQAFDKTFGLYKIILNENLTLKKVVVVKSFGRKFDKKLINIIKKQPFEALKKRKNEVPPDTYLPLLIYFYEEGKFLAPMILP